MAENLRGTDLVELRMRVEAAEDILLQAIEADPALLKSAWVVNLLQYLKVSLQMLKEGTKEGSGAQG